MPAKTVSRAPVARLRGTGASLLLATATLIPTLAVAGPGIWTSGGPYGGPVHALAVDPSNPATVYAGTSGGVYRSTNSGGAWAIASTGLTASWVWALAINPSRPSTLHAGTRGGGVFRSTDAGFTWAATNRGLRSFDVTALVLSPAVPTVLYAGTTDGVFRSTDSGGTWATAVAGLLNT